MSEYLKAKMLRGLRESKAADTLAQKGIDNLKSSISEMDIPSVMPEVEKIQHQPRYTGSDLAEIAIDIYKMEPGETEKKKETKQVNPSNIPSKGQREHTKAIARSLAGLRNGGNEGRPAIAASMNGGNTGLPIPNPNYNMSMEEYTEHIQKKFGIIQEEELPELEEPEQELLIEKESYISELEQGLLKLEDTSWQSIDTLMRGIAKEHDITPKELHKAFKAEHGKIPDEWVKEQTQVEQVGWYPLDEARRINKMGNIFEVSMFWKGDTQRVKFFWPETKMPTRAQMIEASQKFYPGSRMLAYYMTHDDEDNFMVLIPPLTEHYEYMDYNEWYQLDENYQVVYDIICEEEGEPLGHPVIEDDGSLTLLVEDHETGEERVVLFGDVQVCPVCGHDPCQCLEGNVQEATGDVTGHGSRLDTAYHYDMADDNVSSNDIKNRRIKAKRASNKIKREEYVAEDDMKGMSQKSGDKRSTESGAGLTAKGVAKYRAKNPGSKLKTAVTTPPSKLKAGSKAANRRKSFCARSRGWNGERGKAARRRWNC